MADTIIVWFRRDLRMHDNPALHQALENGACIVPVYIYAPEEEAPWQPGAASRWWLHHSLHSLAGDLASLDWTLKIFRGDSLSALLLLGQQTGASAVYWNRLYDPATVARDARIKAALDSLGFETRSFPGYLLREPWEVLTGEERPYKVFTPYSRASFRLGDPSAPLERIQSRGANGELPGVENLGETLDSLRLLPRVHWDAGFYDYWRVGESAAWRRLESFLDGCAADYEATRDRPSIDGTSRLSPHLHFGEISPRAVWHAVRQSLDSIEKERASFAFLRQLLWRDFAHQLLFHFPHISERNFKPKFDAFPWRDDEALLDAWKRGKTGIPLVDAGMRELWHSGFMHNRVRMNAASFLTKNAGIHWVVGARWFWDTLVDANLANNTMGWQWVAGCGPDAAPYFRIFNPATQGERFDPSGDYVRRWLPALSGLPDSYIHAPWKTPANTLEQSDVDLGGNYPEPIVDLKKTRERALKDYAGLKRS